MMKKYSIYLLALVSLFAFKSWGQEESFSIDFSTSAPNQTITAPTGVTISQVDISAGSISYGSFGSTFGGTPHAGSSSGWMATTDPNAAKNFSFTITADPGFTFDLKSVSSLVRSTSAGASDMALLVNGDLIQTVATPNSATPILSVSGTGFTAYDALTSVTVKIAGYDGGSRTPNGNGDSRIGQIEGALIVNSLSLNDTDTEVFAATPQVGASTQIAADITTPDDSFPVLGFEIEDQGTSDGEPTEVTRMRFVPGPNNTAAWSDHIQGITLDDIANSYTPSTTTITDTEIILDFATPIVIADGTSVEFELGVYLNTSNIIDGSIIQFQIDAASSGFDADISGSGFADPFLLGDIVGNNHTIDIEATQLTYITEPSDVIVNTVISPSVVIAFTDVNGLIDIDFSGTGFDISLTTSGSFDLSATTTVQALDGVTTFSNLIFDATGTGVILTATDDSFFISGTYNSNAFDVTASPVFPSVGDLIITEVSDASDFNNEFIEIYNTTSENIDMSSSKLVMQSDGTVWGFDVDISNAIISPNGFLIVTRGANQSSFEGEFGALNSKTVFVQGTGGMFFGTGTKRSWQLYEGGTGNTADGNLIDETVIDVGGNDNRDFFDFLTDAYVSTSNDLANPGAIDNLVYESAAWKYNAKADATTGVSDVYFLDSFIATEGLAMNDGEVSPNKVLDLNGNSLSINGNLTFKSDDSGTAQFADATGVTISGNITVERFIPSKRAFRLLAPAVSGVSIADSWQLDTHITGAGGATNGFDATGTNNSSMFTFDNSLSDQTNGAAWEAVGNTSTTLQAGTPYRLLVRGSRTTVDLADNSSPSSDVTLSATGSIVTGSLTTGTELPALATLDHQFSFVGNPYQAVIDFTTLASTGDVNTDFIYVWDPQIAGENGNGGYVIVDVTSGAGTPNPSSSQANKYIMPGQAFFIRNNASVTTAPTLTFNETAKVTSQPQTQIFSIEAYLNLRLYSQAAWDANDFESDALGIRWSPNYTTPVSDEDSGKLGNIGENLAVNNANAIVGIDKRNLPETEEIIPLFVSNYQLENYVFDSQFAHLPENGKLYLEDHYLETSTLLSNDVVHAFSVDPSIEASMASDRFSIRFDPVTLNNTEFTANSFSMYPNPVQDQLNIAISTELANEAVQVEVFDVLGRSILKNEVSFSQKNTQHIDATSLKSGIYIVKMSFNKQTFTQRIIKM